MPPAMGGKAAGLALGGSTRPGGLGKPVALRLASCSVPVLFAPIAALIGLAAARSTGEYCSAFSSAAAPCSELIMNWSPAAGGAVGTTLKPWAENTAAMVVAGGGAKLSKLNTLPSECRVIEPASAEVKLIV